MKTIFEEMGGTYRQVGYYFIPNNCFKWTVRLFDNLFKRIYNL